MVAQVSSDIDFVKGICLDGQRNMFWVTILCKYHGGSGLLSFQQTFSFEKREKKRYRDREWENDEKEKQTADRERDSER